MNSQQLTQIVRAAIKGFGGGKKWRIARDFVRSLDQKQRVAFVSEYTAQQKARGNFHALLLAARSAGSTYDIAKELATPAKDDKLATDWPKKSKPKA